MYLFFDSVVHVNNIPLSHYTPLTPLTGPAHIVCLVPKEAKRQCQIPWN